MKILVPTDGSSCALRAVKYSISIAKGNKNVKVTLISVHDDIGLQHVRKYLPKGVIAEFLREQSENDLKKSQQVLDRAGVTHDMVIKTGSPAEEIVKLGKTEHFDLIVMGAKGRSSFGDLLVGSVAQKVLSATKLPLTLIK